VRRVALRVGVRRVPRAGPSGPQESVLMGWLRPCLGRGAEVRPAETRSWSRDDVGDLVICAVGGRDPARVWMVVV
jgi:hypothetical protein